MKDARHFLLYLLIACFFLASEIKAQTPDSLRLKKYDKVIYRDTAVIVQRDITIPNDSSILKVKKRKMAKFYYNYMFQGPDEASVLDRVGTTAPFAGKTVGNIWIRKKEPFGTSLADSTKELKDWFINAGNTIHVLTKDRVILNTLLFEKGDILTRQALKESERLLRQLPFILDARVFGLQRNSSADTVDVFVITKDVFSINVNVSPTNYDAVNVSLEEANMFGLGQSLYNNFIFDAARGVGYEGHYTVSNLYGTFMKGTLSYAFTQDSLLAGISNERDFISPDIKNAGGLSYHYRIIKYYSRFDETRARTNVADNNIDAWYGRSFPIATQSASLFGDLRFITAGRISATWFSTRPLVSADTNLVFQHNSLFLFNTGLSRSAFVKDILVASFGVIEDIPIGLLADVTAGYSLGEFVSRPYAGMRISNGTFSKLGYFFNSVQFGSFFHNRKTEDGAFRVTSLYISKLFARKKLFKTRFMLRAQYIRGINRSYPYDMVDLQDVEALRGLESELLFGNTVLAGGATVTVFSPWSLLGFRVGFFSLADLTYFSNRDEMIFSSRPYWGFTNGFRLNNENFIFGTIDFGISVYPSPPLGVHAFSLGLSVNPIFPFPDFSGKNPSVVTYGHPGKVYY